MGINIYDPLSTSENPDINPEIEAFDYLPKTAKEREHYFRPIQDKRNKTSTSIVFCIMTKYSHVKWRKFLVTEITQPCIHTCDGLFICQLYLLPELLEEMNGKEDTPLTLPFALFVSLSQLIIVI
jgi:hypothetical protein